MLERARSEVARLAGRRDSIARELGYLSGVIEALAVPVPTVHHHSPDVNETTDSPGNTSVQGVYE